VLNLEDPHKNSHWILPIMGTNIKVGDDKSVVDALTIYMPVFSRRDVIKKKYKASLLPDGSGISVTVPTISQALLDQVNEIHSLEDAAECEQTKLQHNVKATFIKARAERLKKTLVLKFPRGMTANNKHFNGKGASADDTVLKLKNNFRILDVVIDTDEEGEEDLESVSFIWWKVVIGAPQRLADESDDSEDDYLEAITRRTSRLRITDQMND
jgi:hypothetical protein